MASCVWLERALHQPQPDVMPSGSLAPLHLVVACPTNLAGLPQAQAPGPPAILGAHRGVVGFHAAADLLAQVPELASQDECGEQGAKSVPRE